MIYANISQGDYIDILQRKIYRLSEENIILAGGIKIRDRQITRLKRQAPTAPQTKVTEAVKFAMKAAHPDNGGAAADFIKFRKLYNEMIGGKK